VHYSQSRPRNVYLTAIKARSMVHAYLKKNVKAYVQARQKVRATRKSKAARVSIKKIPAGKGSVRPKADPSRNKSKQVSKKTTLKLQKNRGRAAWFKAPRFIKTETKFFDNRCLQFINGLQNLPAAQIPRRIFTYINQKLSHKKTDGVQSPASLLAKGYGDHDDKALFALLCLKKCGFQSYLLFLPLRRYEQAHNHIVVVYKQGKYWHFFDNLEFGKPKSQILSKVAAQITGHDVQYRWGQIADTRKLYWSELKWSQFTPKY
jgi:hypothetical protein